MAWIEIPVEEYREMYLKEGENLGVFSSATFMAGDIHGERYFPEDYIATTWGFPKDNLPYIRSLKDHGEWHYWKWVGPPPEED